MHEHNRYKNTACRRTIYIPYTTLLTEDSPPSPCVCVCALLVGHLCAAVPPSGLEAHLVVEEDAHDGRHHAQDVGGADGVAQHEQRDADDHDALGGVGHGVAQRADQVQHAEGDHVLGKVAEPADQQQEEGAGPARCVRLIGRDGRGHREEGGA